MRLSPVSAAVQQLIDFNGSTDVQKHQLGMILDASPTDGADTTAGVPNWGQCKVMYVKMIGATALAPGRIVQIDKDFGIADMPNTAGTGKPVAVCISNFAIGNVTAQYGWVGISGIFPVQYSVAATAGIVFFGAAGQASPTQAAGKQILNATCLIAASGSFTKANARTTNGSPNLVCGNVKGIYPGMAVSGTGIPGSTTVLSVSSDGLTVVMSANATAYGSVTATFTHTNFGICNFNQAFVQGQIL